MQMNQLSQQSMMNSSLHKLRAPIHSHLYGGHTTSLLSYNFDISDIDAIDQNPRAVVTMIITLQESHETEIRELVKLCRETELFSKTRRIFLRFGKEHSRRITNYCKLNCENVEVFSANEQSIFEFLQVRGQTINNGRDDASEGAQNYVLCVDFTRLKKNNETFDLLLRHTIGEWKYCLQLFHNDDAIRGVGLFPVPEDLSKDSDFWYDTFWLKVQPRTALTRLQKKEKLELLYASKSTWFSSESQIEDTTFLYDLSSTASLIQKGSSSPTSDSNVKDMSTSTTEQVRQLPSSIDSVSIRRQKAVKSGSTMSIRRPPVDSDGPVETTTTSPIVPETLVIQAQTFERTTNETTAPIVPETLVIQAQRFETTTNETTAPIVPETLVIQAQTFETTTNETVTSVDDTV